MDHDLWKAFDETTVTHSVAHHLAAIAQLLDTRGYARVSDVARMLNITRGAASLMIKTLRQRGLVQVDDQHFLRLSRDAQALVAQIRVKRDLVERVFSDALGVGAGAATADACKIEHLLSDETTRQLFKFYVFFTSEHPAARAFRQAWARQRKRAACACEKRPKQTACEPRCVLEVVSG